MRSAQLQLQSRDMSQSRELRVLWKQFRKLIAVAMSKARVFNTRKPEEASEGGRGEYITAKALDRQKRTADAENTRLHVKSVNPRGLALQARILSRIDFTSFGVEPQAIVWARQTLGRWCRETNKSGMTGNDNDAANAVLTRKQDCCCDGLDESSPAIRRDCPSPKYAPISRLS